MDVLEITGGTALRGTVAAMGNKNAALPMICAALLTDQPVTLENVPDIGDVHTMLEIAAELGASVDWQPAVNQLTIEARDLNRGSVPDHLCAKVRAGVLFGAPLLARLGRACMLPPGGDVIGRRRLDAHFIGLEALGVTIDTGERFEFRRTAVTTARRDIFLPEASVTATEHVLLYAAALPGETIIRNCACEPHVADLAEMLGKMGAAIEGAGTPTLVIRGAERLRGATHRVVADHTEAGSFLALAAATGGEVTVTGIRPQDFRMVEHVFGRLGVRLCFEGDQVTVPHEQTRSVPDDRSGGIPVVDDGPWPQFPSDLMSVTIVLATQLSGTVLFFEKMYESRMYFVDRLVDMGARAVICDPHRVVVSGPASLHGIDLASPDIRAGIALVGAALCSSGTSVIRRFGLVDRGYERIDDKLRALGANVHRHDAGDI